jgi:hypothetical protein
MKAKIKRKIRKGNKLFIKAFRATGIPESYAATAAWFAERAVLGALCLSALAFAAGALFVLRWAEPLGQSQAYEVVYSRARSAQEGIKSYTQHIIDVTSPVFLALIRDNREEEDPEAERLALRMERLKAYLESKKSPFAQDAEAIRAFASSKNMKLMVAISFVESTFGKHCYYYNCSGIGGSPPNLRKYASYAEWIADFDQLLEDRYKNVPIENFIGLYVQPGSSNWLYGVKQVFQEFEEQGIEAQG